MAVRAFELISAVERGQLISPANTSSPPATISCLDACGPNLYVGTTTGWLSRFSLTEPGAHSEAQLRTLRNCERRLSSKDGVRCIRATSAISRLLVLCEGCLTTLDIETLEPGGSSSSSSSGGGGGSGTSASGSSGPRVRGVAAFCVNERPIAAVGEDPFCVEICTVNIKRRTIQVYALWSDRVQLLHDLSSPETPVALVADGPYVCVATSSRYLVIHAGTGHCQPLFPCDPNRSDAIVRRAGVEEFLLAGPGGLGMLVTAAGTSHRAPVPWSETVFAAAFLDPYVIALDRSGVNVHSVLDQALKQTLRFTGGNLLEACEGRLWLASSREVYALVPRPLDKQVWDLLLAWRTEEAMQLLDGAGTILPREKLQSLSRRAQQQRGFEYLLKLQFDEAKQMFCSGCTDVREVASLYPHLLPAASHFVRMHPPLHDTADFVSISAGQLQNLFSYKRFLLDCLRDARREPSTWGRPSTEADSNGRDQCDGWQVDVDTALVKLAAEFGDDCLFDLVAEDNVCILEDCTPWLEKHGRFYALGLLYKCHGQEEVAFQLWRRIVDGELKDTTRTDLLEYLVDMLGSCTQRHLLWDHAAWAIHTKPEVGVRVFTQLPPGDGPPAEEVVSFLQDYPSALRYYLEHLVWSRGLQLEKFHTHLALLYLDEVLALLHPRVPGKNGHNGTAASVDGLKEDADGGVHSSLDGYTGRESENEEALLAARSRLQWLLQESKLYRAHLLLGRLGNAQLHIERAALHGRLGQHVEALSLLVHAAGCMHEARKYCLRYGDASEPVENVEDEHLSQRSSSDGCYCPENGHGNQENGFTCIKLDRETWSEGEVEDKEATRSKRGTWDEGACGSAKQAGSDGGVLIVEPQRPTRRELFTALLRIMLHPPDGRPPLELEASKLLNTDGSEFEAISALKALPEGWSLGLVVPFVTGSLRRALHTRRSAEVARGLLLTRKNAARAAKTELSHISIRLSEDSTCPVCQMPLSEPAFMWFPNGTVVHPACARSHFACPVTGRIFSPEPPVQQHHKS
uniref:transforming growth factor-beta receptor-associated protein 1 isoform X1 n=1 Tax=Myxine glutinosa TaxID=7769 RepID=UPI00358FD26F